MCSMECEMQWSNEIWNRRLRVAGFLILLSGITAFLALTDHDEGPSLWERWTSSKSVAAAGPATLLKQIETIDLPGPKGKRFDYLTIDPTRHLLLSHHRAAAVLFVIDLETNKMVQTLEKMKGIEGVEIAVDVNKAYALNWLENKTGVIDLEQMKLIKK